MMNDTIDDAMAEDGDEAEESEIINKVLEEIGIGMNQEVLPVPSVQKLLAARCVVRRAWEWRSPAAASLRIGLFLRWVAACCPVPALRWVATCCPACAGLQHVALCCAALCTVRIQLCARIGSGSCCRIPLAPKEYSRGPERGCWRRGLAPMPLLQLNAVPTPVSAEAGATTASCAIAVGV